MSAAAVPGWSVGGRREGAAARARRPGRPAALAGPVPLVAVLCAPERGRAAASGVALALARASGGLCALAGAVGGGTGSQALGGSPSARRAAAALRERGLHGAASGRLVWLSDGRAAAPPGDVAGWAAALSAELGRASSAVGAPGAVALPFARSAALDRVLGWYDGFVVVPEPGSSAAVRERVLASLAELRRPVAVMAPPGRIPAALAARGLRVPAEAVDAVAQLGLGGGGCGA